MQKDTSQIKQTWVEDWERVKVEYPWWTRGHRKLVVPYLHGKVCELGSGPGYLAADVFPSEGWYTGVDYAQNALDLGKKLFPGATFVRANLLHDKVPLPDGGYDTVVCSETLEHLEDFSHALREIKRLSKQYIVITVPTSMGGCGHVWPVWECGDVHREFAGLGKLLEVRHCYEAHCHLIWIRK
jgi:SAM-dependent methyltransferase